MSDEQPITAENLPESEMLHMRAATIFAAMVLASPESLLPHAPDGQSIKMTYEGQPLEVFFPITEETILSLSERIKDVNEKNREPRKQAIAAIRLRKAAIDRAPIGTKPSAAEQLEIYNQVIATIADPPLDGATGVIESFQEYTGCRCPECTIMTTLLVEQLPRPYVYSCLYISSAIVAFPRLYTEAHFSNVSACDFLIKIATNTTASRQEMFNYFLNLEGGFVFLTEHLDPWLMELGCDTIKNEEAGQPPE